MLSVTEASPDSGAYAIMEKSLRIPVKLISSFGGLVLIIALLAGWLLLGSTVQPAQVSLTETVYFRQPIIQSVSATAVFHSCVYNESYLAGEYLVLNNQWNRRLMGPNDSFQQCIQVNSFENPLNAEWSWSWPYPQGAVKAYPEIIYGWAPWLDSSTVPHLPMKLSLLGKPVNFEVSFDTSVSASSGAIYNTAFDLFISSSAVPTPQSRTHEVMIWVNDQNPWISTKGESYVGRISISGEKYDLWNSQGIYPIFVFRKVVPISKGSLVINPFLNYLMNKGYLSGEGYLADIEFGNEIIYGLGLTHINHYSITPLTTPLSEDGP